MVAVLVLVGQTAASGATSAKRSKKPAKLVRFDSCKAFNGYAKRHALRRVQPWGLSGAPAARGIGDGTGSEEAGGPLPPVDGSVPSAESAVGADDAAGVPGEDFSTTNVQVTGVDEPDIVKTDGRHLYTVVGGKLHVIDARASLARLLASVDLPSGWEHEIFLHEKSVIVLTRTGQTFFEPLGGADPVVSDVARYSFAGATTLTKVNVRKAAAPTIVESYSIEGSYLSARRINNALRVVVTTPSPLGLDFVFPLDASDETEAEALQTNRREIRHSRARDWVPRFKHTNHRTTNENEGKAVPCRRIRRPASFGGLGTVTILTFNLAKSLRPVDQDAVMTSGDTVYASQRNIYVATQRWIDPATVDSATEFSGARTLIHRFSTAGQYSTVYRGAGRVRGFVLNQFALSEHGGHLRVATTEIPTWWSEGESESFVTALKLQKGTMPKAGQVRGLGRGERIFAVRFIGDMGYVVTFRRIDPLYTVDLSDPKQPVVRGELKMLGYSAYLHPISVTNLIGVGQDATEEGRTLGTQVALYDVSNPTAPTLIDKKTIAGGFSDAEWDQKAFLWWRHTKLAVLPVQAFEYSENELSNWFVGAAGFRIDGESVEDAGRITHPTPGPKSLPEPWRAAIRRAVVVGNRIFTVGDNGVGVSDLATLGRTGWVPLPVATGDELPGPPIEAVS